MADKSEKGGKKSTTRVKNEPMEEEDETPPAFGPAALGLHRVGTKLPPKPTPSEPVQKLNARGMPARIRKKNKLFFDDEDYVSTPPPAKASPKRTPRTPIKTPSKISSAKKVLPIKSPKKTPKLKPKYERDKFDQDPATSPDRKAGQRIGQRLRNLLKLPKAHKWVCFEFFYSNIDKILFEGENDFMICLKESFPQLTNRKLTQVQWAKIRRMMGKPRRCSQAFFTEERKELERKRQIIRFIQQKRTTDVSLKDLPNEIPMQLVVGTKVTARLRKPQDGLFTGSIDAVDTINNTYRITFDRPTLGTHFVPDYEVLSNDSPETISLSAIVANSRTQQTIPNNMLEDYISVLKSRDPLLGFDSTALNTSEGNVAAMSSRPFKLLEMIVRIKKILKIKEAKISKLREYNLLAEKRKSYGEWLPEDFERKYAGIVLELERMNSDLQEYLNEVQLFCNVIAPGPSVAAMLAPSHLRETCKVEAEDIVTRNKVGLEDDSVVDLITDLTALLLQVKYLSDSDRNAYELKVLQGTMQQIKMKLDPTMYTLFENNVEVHMRRIQMGLAHVPPNT